MVEVKMVIFYIIVGTIIATIFNLVDDWEESFVFVAGLFWPFTLGFLILSFFFLFIPLFIKDLPGKLRETRIVKRTRAKILHKQ